MRRLNHLFFGCVWFSLLGLVASLPLTIQFASAAEENEQSAPSTASDRDAKREFHTPDSKPIPGVSGKHIRFSPDTTLIAAPPNNTSPEQQKRQAEDFQKRVQELQNQQEQMAHDYQDAIEAIRQSPQPSAQLDLQRQQLQKRYAGSQAQLAEQLQKLLTSTGVPRPDNAAQNADVQTRLRDIQESQNRLIRDYAESVDFLRMALPPQQYQAISKEFERSMNATIAKIEEITRQDVRQEQPIANPLPDNAALGAFTLKFVRPEDIGQALHNITGESGPRIAVDERTNTLLIAGNPKQMDVAKQLVQTLDQPGKTQQSAAPEALQLRIVWLSEGMSDRDMAPPSATIISAPVADALRELGMEQPQVVCQQLTSVTLKPAGPAGKYVFRVPTGIEDSTWNFEGDGTIMPTSDGRYAMDFKLSLIESNSKNPQPSELSGSILTPLGHYTVMGTTTFVAPRENAGPVQRLSAFVVFLDHPKEFGYAGSSESDSKKSDKKNK